MNVSFDGLRLAIAKSFNSFTGELKHSNAIINEDVLKRFEELRHDIWILMCLYDKENGYDEIWQKVKLIELGEVEE